MNPAIPTPQVPLELIREILEHLESDKPSLCTVSLSSNILREEAQIILFRNVTTLDTESTHLKFLRTVAESPNRLALLVRAYRIARREIFRDLSTRIHDGLRAMCNLKYLGVYYVGYTEMKSPEGLLRGCTFKLESFQWMSDPSEAQELVETFLRGQDKLRRLSMRLVGFKSLERLRPINPAICPHLVSLVGNWHIIKAFLPGHKIMSLMVLDRYDHHTINMDIIGLIPAAKHIKALSYQFYNSFSEEPEPERVLTHFVSLNVLELGWKFDDEKILAVLPKLHSLHTLILPMHPLLGGHFRKEAVAEFSRRAFDHSENLRQIDVQVATQMETYERYTRSPREAAVLPRLSRSEVRRLFPE